ncbi:integrase [Archaeoglobus sp.]
MIKLTQNSVKSGRRHLCYSLRVFFNFLEEFEILDEETLSKLKKIVKILKVGSDNYTSSNEEVIEASYRRIKSDETKMIFKLLAFSGIRVVEASKLLSEFDKSKLMINGNIAKYPLSMLRGTKYAYMPKDFALELRRINLNKQIL